MRRRDLTVGEFAVLRTIQQGYGLQNSLGKVFFTDTDEAAIFVKAFTGRSVLMANLTNLAAWRADGRITSDEELKRDWLTEVILLFCKYQCGSGLLVIGEFSSYPRPKATLTRTGLLMEGVG